jgi:hypothetical protein
LRGCVCVRVCVCVCVCVLCVCACAHEPDAPTAACIHSPAHPLPLAPAPPSWGADWGISGYVKFAGDCKDGSIGPGGVLSSFMTVAVSG